MQINPDNKHRHPSLSGKSQKHRTWPNALVLTCLLMVTLAAVTAMTAVPATADTPKPSSKTAPNTSTPYKGQETRAISSLSDSDVQQLLAGGGWGFAKPAELNGYPGPAHVLELANEMKLTKDQHRRIEDIFKAMQTRAKQLGKKYVAAERAVSQSFRDGSVTAASMQKLLQASGDIRIALRAAHLVAHLQTTKLLTKPQIEKYNLLRGYTGATANARSDHTSRNKNQSHTGHTGHGAHGNSHTQPKKHH